MMDGDTLPLLTHWLSNQSDPLPSLPQQGMLHTSKHREHSRLPYIRTVITALNRFKYSTYFQLVQTKAFTGVSFSFEQLLLYPNLQCFKLLGIYYNIPLFHGRNMEDGLAISQDKHLLTSSLQHILPYPALQTCSRHLGFFTVVVLFIRLSFVVF